MAEAIWNPRDKKHLDHFAANVLGPLVTATRPLDMRTSDTIRDAARAWVLCLKDVPADILQSGVESLMAAGPTWMPRPGDLRQACAGLIAERRKEAGARGQAIIADCLQCDGTGWERLMVNGVERVKKCHCTVRALALLEGLPAPLALPPAPVEGDAA